MKVRESKNPVRHCQELVPQMASNANPRDSARTDSVVGTSRRRGIRQRHTISGTDETPVPLVRHTSEPTTGANGGAALIESVVVLDEKLWGIYCLYWKAIANRPRLCGDA